MPAPKLQLVSHTRSHKAPPPDDPVFFHKGQIKLGTKIKYVGRLDPNSVWTVYKITTTERRAGVERAINVSLCERLSDNVFMRSESGERKCVAFGYMSYSAIWQMLEG